jgi:hypothetical protein
MSNIMQRQFKTITQLTKVSSKLLIATFRRKLAFFRVTMAMPEGKAVSDLEVIAEPVVEPIRDKICFGDLVSVKDAGADEDVGPGEHIRASSMKPSLRS